LIALGACSGNHAPREGDDADASGDGSCIVDMDTEGTGCPNVRAICGTEFLGGDGCLVEGKANCYDSGFEAYKLTDATPVSISFTPGIAALEVFFAHEGTATGTLRFVDASGATVRAALFSNGDCLEFMPDTQTAAFGSPVHEIQASVTGGVAWIDTLTVTRR
jgi:hypothetical protein